MSHKKFGPYRFSPFDVGYKQTDRQAKFIYRRYKDKNSEFVAKTQILQYVHGKLIALIDEKFFQLLLEY